MTFRALQRRALLAGVSMQVGVDELDEAVDVLGSDLFMRENVSISARANEGRQFAKS